MMNAEKWRRLACCRLAQMGYKKDPRYSCDAVSVFSRKGVIASVFGETVTFRVKRGESGLLDKIRCKLDCHKLGKTLGGKR